MLWLVIVLIAAAAILIFLIKSGRKLWKAYLSDVKTSFAEMNSCNASNASNVSNASMELFTETGIRGLPALLQKHIANGGYLNKPLMDNMLIRFHNTKFRMSPDSKPMNIEFMQVNFAYRPDRHAFLTGRMAGLPLNGKDSILDGHGSMTVTFAKVFQLFHVTGPEMDRAQLVTALADAVFMPSLFLQDFITWRETDDHTVEGEIRWKGVSSKGRFSFDECGNIIRFDTDDRYMDDNGKGGALTPWYVLYSDYKEQNGYFQPDSVSVNWSLPGGDDNYFVSDSIEIRYSVNEEAL
ncbi:hypothetical protein MmiAt1_03020 [Methanimicrococcus sp. At1]|uniref:Uncharacterized protein n=2 Tax=Methanimicrococcus hacksteinii TaxID=3028293 RepID=A0ABU3VMY6_9EURY|nr:hypothetical protein [Methanimicrococcus sp. At1]